MVMPLAYRSFGWFLSCCIIFTHNQAIWAASWENRLFAYGKTKTQISFAVTAKLISAFVFAILIVQSLYFLNPKFQASSHLVWLHSLVCVRPGRKPRRPVFSHRGSYKVDRMRRTLSYNFSRFSMKTWPCFMYPLEFLDKAMLMGTQSVIFMEN